ncbi:MAG: ATP-grasp domain-containing protein [Chloroflexota bacterium]
MSAPFVIFVSPYFTDNALRLLDAMTGIPDVRFGLISQDPLERLVPYLRERLAAHRPVDDALDTGQLVAAAQALAQQNGPVHRLFGAVEQLQVPLAEARERLGVEGMSTEAARNFRDKERMKTILRAAGLPCARHRLVTSDAEAWAFAKEVGYPLVIKPPAGAGSQATFRVNQPPELAQALKTTAPAPAQPVLFEEFIMGDEHSWDSISVNGRPLWHSYTHYYPTPLEVMRNPWIQWCILLPREKDEPEYDDVREAAERTLSVLGMTTGMTHLEWFRRRDGSMAISEVAARPPGAQITTLLSRAHDVDFPQLWAKVMIFGTFDPPPSRRYAVGAAFLRGQGQGVVKAIHGLEQAEREIGHLVCDAKLPRLGQSPSPSYEGEGYVIMRHPETAVVEQALYHLISVVRVELG